MTKQTMHDAFETNYEPRLRRTALVFVGIVLTSLVGFSGSAVAQTVVRASETSIRKIATKTVMPNYPEDARKRGVNGVAVAEILVDENGDVVTTETVEAPDESIKKALEAAVKQWKFRPTKIKDGPAVRIRGKLTFYYVLDEKGNGRVESPKQYR